MRSAPGLRARPIVRKANEFSAICRGCSAVKAICGPRATNLLKRITFPPIRTFDSSRTPKRGERLVTPRTRAEVDLTAIITALAAAGGEDPGKPKEDPPVHARLVHDLAAARARIAALEENNCELHSRLAKIVALAASAVRTPVDTGDIAAEPQRKIPGAKPVRPSRVGTSDSPTASGNGIHPAARKLLTALAQHAPARFTWGQAATLAGLKPSGGHFNSGRSELRAAGYVVEANGLVADTRRVEGSR